MAFCSKCGKQINSNGTFCSSCGAPVNQQAKTIVNSQPSYQQTNYQQPGYQQYANLAAAPSVNTTGLFIWSIINLFLCVPGAIAGFVYVNKANKAQTQIEADEAIKKAQIWNGLTTGVSVFIIIIAILSNS